jgi:hypothetical protein
MTAQQIKDAVLQGNKVFYGHKVYEVVTDKHNQWLIKYIPNGHCFGLTWEDGTTLNGDEYDFYIEDLFLADIEHDFPKDVSAILNSFDFNTDAYSECKRILELIEPLGYSFDYDLSGEPYNLCKINPKKLVNYDKNTLMDTNSGVLYDNKTNEIVGIHN